MGLLKTIVDVRNPAPVDKIWQLFHFLHGFIHPRW